MGTRHLREESEALNERIRALSLSGITSREVAEKLGMDHNKIKSRITRMRESGKLPPLAWCRGTEVSTYDAVKVTNFAHGARLGSIRQLVNCLSKEHIKKLAKETPQGMTIAEYIAAIVKDELDE
jgi:hypothetical protein